MKIKVLKTHPHGGKIRRQGAVYDCPDKKARLMVQLGKAEEYVEPVPPPRPVRKKAAAKAAPKVETKVEPKATPKVEPMDLDESKSSYKTKVLTAED